MLGLSHLVLQWRVWHSRCQPTSRTVTRSASLARARALSVSLFCVFCFCQLGSGCCGVAVWQTLAYKAWRVNKTHTTRTNLVRESCSFTGKRTLKATHNPSWETIFFLNKLPKHYFCVAGYSRVSFRHELPDTNARRITSDNMHWHYLHHSLFLYHCHLTFLNEYRYLCATSTWPNRRLTLCFVLALM